MMIPARVTKHEDGSWSSDAPLVGVFMQGKTREQAIERLVAGVEFLIAHEGCTITATDHGDDEVLLEASHPGLLAALMLKVQRDMNGLSLGDVAKRGPLTRGQLLIPETAACE